MPQQIANANLASFFNQVWARLSDLADEHTTLTVGVMQPTLQVSMTTFSFNHSYTDHGIQSFKQAFERIVDPLTTAIHRELGAIIAKLHRIDFAKPLDSNAGMGGSSLYIKELTEKLSFIKSEIVSRYSLGDYGRTWLVLVYFIFICGVS